MPTPSSPPVHCRAWLLLTVCCGIAGSACRQAGDDGYREVTQADVRPVLKSPENTTTKDSPVAGVDPAAGSTAKTTGLPTTEPEPEPKPAVATPADPVPRKIKLLVKQRAFKVEGPAEAWRISFDDFDLLKVLNMDPVPDDASKHMPDWLKQLDGKRIRVRGFMYPTFQDPVSAFVLARDNQICCFGRNPKIYDLVRVAMRDGETSAYIQNRPFDVVGRFHIAGKVEDGKLLYSLDDAIVIDR
ncbi:MAG: hypothetical protein CMJ65_17280 [Planctomycetaceae bacterium]|jgi:hypothetical protein|nr:hypothetical protein [Planctomycetaceae bacterium]